MSKHIPNLITAARLLMIPFVYFFYLADFVPSGKIIALSLFLIAASTDFLDGFIARKYNLVSNLGKLLDPIADKMLFYSGLFLIIVSNILPIWAAAVIFSINLCRDFCIDCLRMLASSKGIVLAANIYGKIKTFISFIAVPWLMFQAILSINTPAFLPISIIGYVLIGLSTFFCLMSGIIYLAQNRKIFAS